MIHDFKTLILSSHPVIVVETVEEERVRRLIDQAAAELEMAVFDWSITKGLVRHGGARPAIDPKLLEGLPPEMLEMVPHAEADGHHAIHDTHKPISLVNHLEDLTVEAVFHLKDFAPHLKNAEVARKFREVAQAFSGRRATMVLTGPSITLPGDIDHKAIHFDLQLPTRDELREAIKPVMRSISLRGGVELHFTNDEFDDLLAALSGMTLNQARQIIAYAGFIDGRLDAQDVSHIIERKAKVIRDGGLLEFFPVDSNRHELGGFDRLKEWLARARVGFSEEAKALNLEPPRGIMLVGVQGCGKSLAAKVTAKEWRLPLLKLDAGRLFDKYIGESEKNFRKAIALAESMAPAVLWIDEIEKAMPTSSSSDNDGGLSRRLFGAFLTWLQEKSHPVFVVATANDLKSTPPELLRKGRFDEIFFVDLPAPRERDVIFAIHLGLRKQRAESFEVAKLVEATEGFSGAEIEQVVIGGLYRALHERKPLDTALLLEEVKSTVPLSVSKREDIARLRSTAQGRFVPVHAPAASHPA